MTVAVGSVGIIRRVAATAVTELCGTKSTLAAHIALFQNKIKHSKKPETIDRVRRNRNSRMGTAMIGNSLSWEAEREREKQLFTRDQLVRTDD